MIKNFSRLELLIAGLRDPEPGMERHFVQVMQGLARPATREEAEWHQLYLREGARLRAEAARYNASPEQQDYKYGLCIDCGGDIPDARLEAVPGCQRCVSCQEKFEAITDIRTRAEGNTFTGTPFHNNRGFSRDDS
jgi:phage/conjugal plasmid C-4 type zinc finger TraR family protein